MIQVVARTTFGDISFEIPEILAQAVLKCRDVGELFDVFSRLKSGVLSQAEAAAYEGSGSNASAAYHARLATEAEVATGLTTDQMLEVLKTPLEIFNSTD